MFAFPWKGRCCNYLFKSIKPIVSTCQGVKNKQNSQIKIIPSAEKFRWKTGEGNSELSIILKYPFPSISYLWDPLHLTFSNWLFLLPAHNSWHSLSVIQNQCLNTCFFMLRHAGEISATDLHKSLGNTQKQWLLCNCWSANFDEEILLKFHALLPWYTGNKKKRQKFICIFF